MFQFELLALIVVMYLTYVTAERRSHLTLSFTSGNFTIGGSSGTTSYQPPM